MRYFRIAVAFLLSAVMVFGMRLQLPDMVTRGEQSQETIDAIQNKRLDTLELIQTATSTTVQDINTKMNLFLGGVSVIAFLLGVKELSVRVGTGSTRRKD